MNRRRLQATFETMDFDFGQFSLATFVDWIAQRRGKPIELQPWPSMPRAFSGLWLSHPETEHIYYADNLPPLLERITILHELAHILLGHQTLLITEPPRVIIGRLLQQLDLVQCRSIINPTPEDREAEQLALLIHHRVLLAQAKIHHPSSPGTEFLKSLHVF